MADIRVFQSTATAIPTGTGPTYVDPATITTDIGGPLVTEFPPGGEVAFYTSPS